MFNINPCISRCLSARRAAGPSPNYPKTAWGGRGQGVRARGYSQGLEVIARDQGWGLWLGVSDSG